MVEKKKGIVHKLADYATDALVRWKGATPSRGPSGIPDFDQPTTAGGDGGSMQDGAGPAGAGRRVLTAAIMREWTQAATALLYQTFDYNPDDLVQTKGQHVKIYQQMVRDPYVKAGLAIKKLSVLRLPTEILPASTDAKDQEIAKFVESQFDAMQTPWHQFLWGLMDSANIGYSIGEINYCPIQRGEWAGKIGWATVKSKDPYAFSFRIAKNGDVEKVVQRFGAAWTKNTDSKGEGTYYEYPPDKFLISSFQPLYANPYGNSDLRAAYRAYFIKDWAWKFRAIFMEKWGSPTVVGSFPNGTSEARRKQLEEVLESIQQETTLTIPEDLKIELIRVATTGNITEYERAISDLNKEILVGLLGSFLAVEEGKRTGARSQGQVHLWIAKLFIEALVYTVQEDINRQMIRRLVDMNYPNVEKYPKLKFELSRVEELLMELELDSGLQTMGMPIDADYVAKKYGRPVKGEYVGLPVDGQDDKKVGDVLTPLAITQQKMTQKAQADAAAQRGDPSRGENPKAAGPSDKPKTNLMEQMEVIFYKMREEALPGDPKKIGPLKENYAAMVRMYGALRNHKFTESEDIAFALAGAEREHHKETGKWMSPITAYARFLGTCFEKV